MMQAQIAVIGGTGIYQLEGSRLIGDIEVPTPFGLPSDLIRIVEVAGTSVAFLPRHGRGHRLLPTEIPSRANIWALKSLGVEQILAVSAVGSLDERYAPGELVVCDQLIDRTRSRPNSFFGEGIVAHLPFADPYCPGMRSAVLGVLKSRTVPCHPRGTLVCMEGPLFSTRAESNLYRGWGADLIGMTALPEAKLAREAEICCALIAMVTDYDCWHEAEEAVSVEKVLEVMGKNIHTVRELIPGIVAALNGRGDCGCRHAAEKTIVTAADKIPYQTRRALDLFYGKYWRGESSGD
jgi:5'-methylthioadenosine phosphorylase